MTGRRRPSFALLLAVLLPACEDSGTELEPPPVFLGTYALESFDGQPVPLDVAVSTSLVADTIVASVPLGVTQLVEWRTYLTSHDQTAVLHSSLRFEQSGDSIFLTALPTSRLVARGRVTDAGVSLRTLEPVQEEAPFGFHPLGAHDWVHRRID